MFQLISHLILVFIGSYTFWTMVFVLHVHIVAMFYGLFNHTNKLVLCFDTGLPLTCNEFLFLWLTRIPAPIKICTKDVDYKMRRPCSAALLYMVRRHLSEVKNSCKVFTKRTLTMSAVSFSLPWIPLSPLYSCVESYCCPGHYSTWCFKVEREAGFHGLEQQRGVNILWWQWRFKGSGKKPKAVEWLIQEESVGKDMKMAPTRVVLSWFLFCITSAVHLEPEEGERTHIWCKISNRLQFNISDSCLLSYLPNSIFIESFYVLC